MNPEFLHLIAIPSNKISISSFFESLIFRTKSIRTRNIKTGSGEVFKKLSHVKNPFNLQAIQLFSSNKIVSNLHEIPWMYRNLRELSLVKIVSAGMISMIPFPTILLTKSSIFRYRNVKNEVNKELNTILAEIAVFNQQDNLAFSSNSIIISPRISDLRNYSKFLISLNSGLRIYQRMLNAAESIVSFNKDNMHKNRYKLPSVLLHNKLFFNNVKNDTNKFVFTDPNQTIGKEDLVMKQYYSNRHDNFNFFQKKYGYKNESEDLCFLDSKHLEYEIEQIKRDSHPNKRVTFTKINVYSWRSGY